jgi:hypothetical protein
MGQMKWIYTMVQDGSYSVFKIMYEKARENKMKSFVWNSQEIDINFAYFVCEYIDKFVTPDYNAYIEKQNLLHETKRNYG